MVTTLKPHSSEPQLSDTHLSDKLPPSSLKQPSSSPHPQQTSTFVKNVFPASRPGEVSLNAQEPVYFTSMGYESELLRQESHPEAGAKPAHEVPFSTPPKNLRSLPSVRTSHQPGRLKELDILWSGTQALFHHREETPKPPMLYFGSGVVVGALVTGVIIFLAQNLFNPVMDGSQMLTDEPDAAIEKAVSAPPPAAAPPKNEGLLGLLAGKGNKQQTTPVPATPPSAPRKVHKVRTGETLAGICQRHYGTIDPGLVEKVQRINGMKSPHELQIDLTLILPPRAELTSGASPAKLGQVNAPGQ